MTRFRAATAAVALLMLGTGAASANDRLTPGRKLWLSDRAGRQRVAFVAKSPVIVAPTPQGSDDPTSVGASLRLVNPSSGESASFDLPASHWSRNASGTLYKFKNSAAPAPPSEVKIALLRTGRLKVSARASGITLNELSQGSIGVVLSAGSVRYCALFGGQHLADLPGRFSAKNAPAPTSCPQTRYDLANGCHALKSVPRDAYAVRGGDGSYTASSPDTAGATPFFMKPTALGKYLFYADDRSLLSVSGDALTGFTVGSSTALAEAADWTVDTGADGGFTIASETAGQVLAVEAGTGKLILANAASAGDAAKFNFDPATGCAEFPELKDDAVGETFKGRGVDQPVLGFAEVHAHVSATTFLGGAHYGAPFHRFGVTQAVGNCASVHGPDGRKDVVGNFLANQPTGTHDTQGWPTFHDWPARGSLTHEATYYKWIERAWKAGLRILMNNLVENELLCQLQNENSGDPTHNCNEMDNAELEAHFMRDMVDYIDAQEGGPGKGWFRIVTSPSEARQVINDGKLAVVLGIEISHLFNCKLHYLQGGLETYDCDQAAIDAQLERLYNLGVREMFAIHEFDNAFGGNGIFDGFVLNLGNRGDTGKFWQTYDCPNGGEGPDYFYDAGAIMTTVIPPGPNNPFVDLLIANSGGNLPAYPPDKRQCNARWLTDLGRYAFQKLMQKKIIVEADHLELMVKSQLLDMAEAQNPVYPVISTHGGHGGISMDQARRIMADGGLIYDHKGNGRDFTNSLNKLLPLRSANYFFGMGYGADTNGLSVQAGPRGAGATPVQYPFTLFQGADWGPQFAGIAPVTFNESTVPESGRAFDVNTEGMAHYGLVADFVEEVRIEGGAPALTALYDSAEAYLQMWERTLNR